MNHMNLRKNEIKLQFIAPQILDECPVGMSAAFEDGFIDSVEAYFIHLDCCSAPFINSDGSYYVDLHYVTESTLEIIENRASKQRIDQTKDYWLGVMTAITLAEMKIKLAYKFHCESEAA